MEIYSDPLLAPLERSPDGVRVGDCILVEKIGQGGMGAVYLGRHTHLHIDVAVKVLPFHAAAADSTAVSRFQKEARSTVRIDHPNIVRVFDVSEEKGVHYLVMEFVDGESAAARMEREGPLPERDALEIAVAAGEALTAAHAKGILHRDVKPANILIRHEDGRVKLADLGLAKALGGEGGETTGLTATGQMMGTPAYMSPEQATDASRTDERTDIYSLGATLYALLSGRAPFEATQLLKLLLNVTREQPEELRKLRPDVTEETAAAVGKLMAKKPAKRPQTITEAVELLRWCLESAPTEEARGLARLELPGKRKVRLVAEERTPTPPAPRTLDDVTPLEARPPVAVRMTGGKKLVIALAVLAALGAAGGAAAYLYSLKLAADARLAEEEGRSQKHLAEERRLRDEEGKRKEAERAAAEKKRREEEARRVEQERRRKEAEAKAAWLAVGRPTGSRLPNSVSHRGYRKTLEEIRAAEKAGDLLKAVRLLEDLSRRAPTLDGRRDARRSKESLELRLYAADERKASREVDDIERLPAATDAEKAAKAEHLRALLRRYPETTAALKAREILVAMGEVRVPVATKVERPSWEQLSAEVVSLREKGELAQARRKLRRFLALDPPQDELIKARKLLDRVELQQASNEARAVDQARTKFGPAPALTIDLGGGVRMEMVYIKPGRFMMGSNAGDADEEPVHEVVITKGFYLGKYEVTQEQYERVMGTNRSRFKGAKNPVETVLWNDATEFCRKLTDIMGTRKGPFRVPIDSFRLPTEAEWEYACRAGSTSWYCFGSYEGRLGGYAWYSSNSGRETHPVGQQLPNAWGLFDMHGNVCEWCADWYDERCYGKGPREDPKGPATGMRRVLRGGSWHLIAWSVRSANRSRSSPLTRANDFGFRVAAASVAGE